MQQVKSMNNGCSVGGQGNYHTSSCGITVVPSGLHWELAEIQEMQLSAFDLQGSSGTNLCARVDIAAKPHVLTTCLR